MAEKLIIKNFVGIKDLEIEVKKINVLIGPQASGKSICAKLLFYFKNFPWDIISAVENVDTKRKFDTTYSKKFIEYFPPESWGNNEFLIRYELYSMFIEIKRLNSNNKNKILITYADSYNQELLKLRKVLNEFRGTNISKNIRYEQIIMGNSTVRGHLSRHLSQSLCKEASFTQLFVPAGRSFFANLQNNIFSFLHTSNVIDPFLKVFGSTYESVKMLEIDTLQSLIKLEHLDEKNILCEMIEIVEKALCGKYLRYKGRDYIETIDHRRVSLSNTSSGQQEILPLLLILTTLPFLVEATTGRTVYIEEPEAHLFPQAQKHIIELIATLFNYHEDKLQFFITTHSPYTLTSFNNLLQAGILYKELDAEHLEELEKIVPRYKALSPEDFSAYALADGKCTSIICPETRLIDATIIDSVSDDLAIEFDNLLNLV